MTPEQVCKVLERHNVLRVDDRYWVFPYPSSDDAFHPEDVLEDGNVAMAAWEAVASKTQALRIDRSEYIVLDVWWDDGSQGQYKVEGTDTAAFTTACAMALANKEERL